MRGHLYPLVSMAALGPITLTGTHIRLEPMRSSHTAALLEAGRASEIWEWMPARPVTADTMVGWLEKAKKAESQGREYPFVVVRLEDDRVIGSTRYLDVQEDDRTVEIGWTWYSPDVWGGVVNPEAKYLLMRHAFDDWRAIRLALKTDIRNVHSQAAIKKLGARYEGTLRNQRIRPDGSYRDTVVFSITEAEWPAVKGRLEQRIASLTPPARPS
jgi:RimJ/RimL family protein N-acetyltransferase